MWWFSIPSHRPTNHKGSSHESTRHQRPQPQHARYSRAGHLRQRQLRPLGSDLQGGRRRTGFDEVEVFQSNHEGSIVDKIQEAYGKVDGIVINPAAYTHTSVAILDALKAVAIPAVEVHISAVETREDFRQVSYARLACFATITGEGLQGYAHALELLRERLD